MNIFSNKQRGITDFFLLGGSSFIFLPILYLAFPPGNPQTNNITATLFQIALVLDFTINFPHFAYSYLIFYRDFSKKIRGNLDIQLKPRFWFAGIFVPFALITLLTIGAVKNNLELLGLLVNLRLFTLGWHYAKQGLGVFSLINREHRVSVSRFERIVFHSNTHLAWLAIWAQFNRASAPSRYIGIPFQSFALPDLFVQTFALLAAASLLLTICLVIRRSIFNKIYRFPINSLFAYFSASYLWIFFRLSLGESRGTALAFLFAPLFHSLQYYAIAHRVEKNRTGSVLKFATKGVLLGTFGFLIAPLMLDKVFPNVSTEMHANFFKFAFWSLINIHHFFIDNVSWRRESESVQRYLVTNRND